MAARPAAPASLTPPAELEQMVARAGLNLNAGQIADLALAWRQLGELLGRIPRTWNLVDDQAFVFQLPPPIAAKPTGEKSASARPSSAIAPVRPARKAAAKAPAKAAPTQEAPARKSPPAKAPAKRR